MNTTDTGAKKIEGTDNWRQIFGAHNDTVDAYDANIEALQDALGIVVNGNQSAVSASSGQFIILKNSSIVDSGDVMLADGLYTAAKAIPANTVIDKTYLTADANGGLNALNSKFGLHRIGGNTSTNLAGGNKSISLSESALNYTLLLCDIRDGTGSSDRGTCFIVPIIGNIAPWTNMMINAKLGGIRYEIKTNTPTTLTIISSWYASYPSASSGPSTLYFANIYGIK